VGYPGETEEDFAELMEFVKTTRFDRLGVFAYSEEEGTYSATRLKDDVAEEVKHERVDRIMRLQERVSLENNARYVGRRMRVIVDRKEGDFYIGRSEYDSPEVDQELIIDSGGKRLYRGRFYEVEVTDCEDYDLYARIV
jgi:ribosomal protein S12 methylthiotransferase